MGWSPRTAAAVEWINLSLECYWRQSWKVMPALRRSPKDKVESQALKQEAVTLKLLWRLKDVKDARAMADMLRKAANREWNQPRRKQFVAVNKDDKGVEIWRPLWHQPWRWRVWNLPSWFPVLIWGLQLSDWIDLRRDFELWIFNIVDTVIDYGDFGSWTKYTFIVLWLDMAPIDSFNLINCNPQSKAGNQLSKLQTLHLHGLCQSGLQKSTPFSSLLTATNCFLLGWFHSLALMACSNTWVYGVHTNH